MILTIALSAFMVLGNAAASTPVPDLVLRNAPVFVSRTDQIGNPETDRLLALAYSVTENARGEITIRYTTVFSDEDSISKVSGTNRQIARYGRRLDVEWAYEIRFDQKGRANRRRFHCDIVLGAGHRICKFTGAYYQKSERPILYVNARHNVFGDRPKLPYGSSRGRITTILPTIDIPYPKSRDMVPLDHPELLRESDLELEKERKLGKPSTAFAYVRLRGKLSTPVHITLKDPSGVVYRNGKSNDDTLREMGLDLWGKESVVGIPLPESVKFALKNAVGTFNLGTTSALGIKNLTALSLEDVGVYLVDRGEDGQYFTTDLSDRVRCSSSNDLSTCTII